MDQTNLEKMEIEHGGLHEKQMGIDVRVVRENDNSMIVRTFHFDQGISAAGVVTTIVRGGFEGTLRNAAAPNTTLDAASTVPLPVGNYIFVMSMFSEHNYDALLERKAKLEGHWKKERRIADINRRFEEEKKEQAARIAEEKQELESKEAKGDCKDSSSGTTGPTEAVRAPDVAFTEQLLDELTDNEPSNEALDGNSSAGTSTTAPNSSDEEATRAFENRNIF